MKVAFGAVQGVVYRAAGEPRVALDGVSKRLVPTRQVSRDVPRWSWVSKRSVPDHVVNKCSGSAQMVMVCRR